MKAGEIFEFARRMELDLAGLYRDLAMRLNSESEEGEFFARMAAQEQVHAAWVEEIKALTEDDYEVPGMETEEFKIILDTIADVHDEVVNTDITLADAAEIIVHLESSSAEQFYLRLPDNLPNVPPKLIERMVESCRIHAQMVARKFGK